MSFDIFLLKFSKGEPCELSREALRPVLHRHEVRQISEGFYNIRLQDGSEVELSASFASSKRFTSAAFYIRGMSDSIVHLVFESAQATGAVLVPAMENNPCIMVDTSQRIELPSDFTLPLVECRSAEELARLLRGGYQAWSKYRDQIVEGHEESDSAT